MPNNGAHNYKPNQIERADQHERTHQVESTNQVEKSYHFGINNQ